MDHRLGISETRLHVQHRWRPQDYPRSNHPERRTELVARELARYQDVGASYAFWSSRPKAERQDAGVAFAIRNDIVRRLPCLPQGTNDQLMSLRLTLRGGIFVTNISVYAPKMTGQTRQKQSSSKNCMFSWRLCRRRTGWLPLVTTVPLSGRQRHQQSIKEEPLDGPKPSELLRRMRARLGDMQIAEKLVKEMFQESLPENVQTILQFDCQDLTVHKVDKMADGVIEVQRFQPPSAAHISTSSLTMNEQLSPPVFARPRRLESARFEATKAEFEHKQQLGVSRPCKSPWASLLNMMSKVTSGDWRPCGNYRALNNATIPDQMTLLYLQDFVRLPFGRAVLSEIDFLLESPKEGPFCGLARNTKTCRILRGNKEDVVSVCRITGAVAKEPPELPRGQKCDDSLALVPPPPPPPVPPPFLLPSSFLLPSIPPSRILPQPTRPQPPTTMSFSSIVALT
nr:unnamed protein product [Spirometra erinaceieuropaei]